MTGSFRRWGLITLAVFAALMVACAVSRAAQDGDRIDWDRARNLHQKQQHGEQLTNDEKAYLERARQARSKNGQPSAPTASPRPTVGLLPLTDMGAQRYKEEDGGLYGGGRNEPPEAHRKAAEKELAQVQPLDADGKPSPGGRIVLVSIGMSNTTQEFSLFKALAEGDPQKSPWLVIVDGTQGGADAGAWANAVLKAPTGRPSPWSVLDQRLTQAGVSARQVQVLWLKQALAGPARYGDFPAHARKLQQDVVIALRELKARFPNLRIAYLSSRIYGGYATTALNPEPYAYDSAFAMRWVIQAQINGETGLNYDPARGEVRAPLVLWGPYLWADGVAGRNTDALKWERSDFVDDGTHPADSGRRKVADLLLAFFRSDSLARSWFLKSADAGEAGPH